VLACLFLFCAETLAKETWLRVKTSNFILISNASENDVRKVGIKLEQFRAAISIIFPKTKLETPTPTTVVLFRTDDAFRPFKPQLKGKPQENVGGYFLAGPHTNYFALAAEDRGLSSYEIVFHEYEHYILHNNLLRIPVWLDEGLAEFYSSFETSDKDQKATLGVPIGRHVFYLRAHTIIPLKTLLTVDHKSPYYSESSKAGTFYAESWALVHYLMIGNQGKRQQQLKEFIKLLNTDLPPEQMFQQAFQTDLKTIEDELRPYLNRATYPVLTVTLPQRLSVEAGQTSTLWDAEIQYYLGDLLWHLGRMEDAEARLKKSISLEPGFAPSLVSLGIIRLRQQKTDEAKDLFRSGIESDPKNYLAHYYYAGRLRAEKHFEEAIESYKQALLLKPDASLTLTSLGYAYLQSGKDDDAIQTFTRGLRVNPREDYFYRSLANIFLQRRMGQTAVNHAVGYLILKGWREDYSAYMALVKYFGLRQAERRDEAAKALDEAGDKLDNTAWPYPVIQYLKHRLTLQQLIALADNQDKLTEAHAYTGLELSLNGDRAAALEHLRWVKENGNKAFVEFPLALAEIARLEAAPAQAP